MQMIPDYYLPTLILKIFSMEEERALAVFERKILQKIYGPVKKKRIMENSTKRRTRSHNQGGEHGQVH
jgi:hypothetical protein